MKNKSINLPMLKKRVKSGLNKVIVIPKLGHEDIRKTFSLPCLHALTRG